MELDFAERTPNDFCVHSEGTHLGKLFYKENDDGVGQWVFKDHKLDIHKLGPEAGTVDEAKEWVRQRYAPLDIDQVASEKFDTDVSMERNQFENFLLEDFEMKLRLARALESPATYLTATLRMLALFVVEDVKPGKQMDFIDGLRKTLGDYVEELMARKNLRGGLMEVLESILSSKLGQKGMSTALAEAFGGGGEETNGVRMHGKPEDGVMIMEVPASMARRRARRGPSPKEANKPTDSGG